MRIVRFLARAGIASRRKAFNLIKQGLIKVNGELISEPWILVNPECDRITLRDKEINLPEKFTYFLLNKPRGVITTCSDEHGRKTVLNFIDSSLPGFVPIGRLDEDSEGLLIITNDGELVFKLTHPSFEIEKEYKVILERKPGKEIKSLINGIKVGKEYFRASLICFGTGKTVYITLKEGKNKEIRRMLGSLGYTIERLIRIRIGNLKLGNLESGKYRKLKSNEVIELKKLCNGT